MFLSTNKSRPNTANEIPRYFLSLGAGQHQLSLIQAARDLGLRVIAVDRNLGAPGFRYADLQLQCSILRPRRIIRMLGENMTDGRIVGVGCRSFGRANVAAALVARHFRTPGPTLAHLKHFRDKRANKLLLQKAGVSMPRIFTWDSNAGRLALSRARPPLIVRPAVGHGKVGLQLLNKAE
ncbi:MAG: hypothetical protein KDK34_10455, partial [Leptospiraceae bacterium]|nr:hypothetical protein [Leptospiraceae bacterium]